MNPLVRILVDPLERTDRDAPARFQFSPKRSAWLLPLGIGAVLLLLAVAMGVAGAHDGHLFSQRFFFVYLVAYTFCLTASLGALFFVMIQHITRARWSIVVRRIPEILMMNFPLLVVFAIPILLGMHDLYHWTHESLYEVGGPEYDAILAGKRSYLNTPWFIVRLVLYFLIWTLLSLRLYRLSIRQDTDPESGRSRKERTISAIGIILFGFSTAYAGFDLLMSLDPHWFSTMFGVYFFSGAFFVILALVTLGALYYRRLGLLRDVITTEHYHDLGKFMFAFTVFWAYIAFSQYMLIWYGNLPEETVWFRHRLEGSWGGVSLALLIGHFVIPFFVLMLRAVKRNFFLLTAMGFWFLVVHFLDLYWLAMPVLDHGFHPAWIDLTIWLGFVLLFAGVSIFRASRHATVPFNDPHFGASLAFENA